MTPERWGRIESACQAALAVPLGERASAVDRACGDDAELRADVLSLLREQERADHLLDLPAWEAASLAFVGDDEAEPSPRLEPGQRLGPFAIEKLVAVGGMGEVYKAIDTRLGRTVAVKVLPPDMAADAESRRRFEFEARAVSGLAHPHICALFDIGSTVPSPGSAGLPVDYLVMEYLEGRTLAQRLAPPPLDEGPSTRPALTLEEALVFGVQIADALAAAHRRGIVHCDLKPANVMLTRDGVKLLDFGIARMKRAALAEDDPGAAGLKQAVLGGALHGTAGYVAPELFEGRDPDARSDLFAFGALLFEMVTGQHAFDGTSPASVAASVLGNSPPTVSRFEAQAPPALDDLVRRCLSKDPDARWDSARLAADELRGILEDLRHGAPAPTDAAPVRPAPPVGVASAWRWFAIVAALAAVGAIVIALSAWRPQGPAPRPLERFDLDLGGGFEVHPRFAHALLSPDASRIVFTTVDPSGASRLVTRRLDGATPVTLAGASSYPSFSPDGRWVAYFSGGRLYKVSVDGGVPVPVCDAPFANNRGASWGDDGTMVVAPDAVGGLVRVPASGGVPVSLTTLDPAREEVTHRWPQVLPGSRAVLFTAHRVAGYYDDATIEAQRLDTGERKTLHHGGYFGRYLPSGHLVFVRHDTLYAAPMDLERLQLTGSPVPVIEEVVADAVIGRYEFSVSDAGTAVGLTGTWQPPQTSLAWYDRSGRARSVSLPPGSYADPRVSPRGDRIVFSLGNFTSRLLAIAEPGLKEPRRLPSDRYDISPIWAPDGEHLVFGRDTEIGVTNLYWRRADGSGPVQRLTSSPHIQWASAFSPDGRVLSYTEIHPETGTDIWTVSLDLSDPDRPVAGTPRPFLRTALAESGAAYSPDGRWVAYASVEAGESGIYVRRADGGDQRWPVSRGEGSRASWVRGRNEILYEGPGRAPMLARYELVGGDFRSAAPAPWPRARVAPNEGSYTVRNFDLSPDGERLLVLEAPEPAPPRARAAATLFLNFFDELKRRTGR